MRRVRFSIPYTKENVGDTRPVEYPTPYPAWVSGNGLDPETFECCSDSWVVFAPDDNTEQYVKNYWPEFNGSFDFNDPVDAITTTSRFQIDYTIYNPDGTAKRAPMAYDEPDYQFTIKEE